MLQPYPEPDYSLIDESAKADVYWLKEVVSGVRNIRGEMDISAKPIPVLFLMATNMIRPDWNIFGPARIPHKTRID